MPTKTPRSASVRGNESQHPNGSAGLAIELADDDEDGPPTAFQVQCSDESCREFPARILEASAEQEAFIHNGLVHDGEPAEVVEVTPGA